MTRIWQIIVSQPLDNSDGPRRWERDPRKTNQNLSLRFTHLATRREDLWYGLAAKLRCWSLGPMEETCVVGENDTDIQEGRDEQWKESKGYNRVQPLKPWFYCSSSLPFVLLETV